MQIPFTISIEMRKRPKRQFGISGIAIRYSSSDKLIMTNKGSRPVTHSPDVPHQFTQLVFRTVEMVFWNEYDQRGLKNIATIMAWAIPSATMNHNADEGPLYDGYGCFAWTCTEMVVMIATFTALPTC